MPTFLSGQQNLAALTVPGVYIDIIPPSPFITGAPTNVEGIVGVASWGPVNTPVFFTSPANCALMFGNPATRFADLPTYVWAGGQVGSAVNWCGIRVTDGTDVAAANTLSVGSQATGTITFALNPLDTATITLNGTVVTFKTTPSGSNQVQIANTLAGTLQNLQLFLNNSNDAQIVKCSYVASATVLTITFLVAGTSGNSFTIAASVATPSGGTLTGGTAATAAITITSKYTGSLGNSSTYLISTGSAPNSFAFVAVFPGATPEVFNNITGAGNAFWVNLANAINNGTSQRAPSKYFVATAGASTNAPQAFSTAIALTGGTDGASGVGTAALLGQDTFPRKGMYSLRESGCDCAALADCVDTTSWAAQNAFGISEDIYMITATASGDNIGNALTTRVGAGLDAFSMKIMMGDWPYFYDTFQGLSRLVSPQAFALGLYGNLTPQNSALNKPINGVVATQASNAMLLYSSQDLSRANQGGIDLIVPPLNAPGGSYFTMMTGRNTSSNTANNGDEYTRMTNFIARSLQSFATGSFVGRPESINTNDRTRLEATMMLQSYLQFLKDPPLNMIDGYNVTCDLTNNTPSTIAAGFMFAYVSVRYLGIVRYFVIMLAGGSNVSVTNQALPPAPSQFA
jgi:hypothetical protein